MSHYLNASQLAGEAGILGLTEIVLMLEAAAQKAAEAIAAKRGDVAIEMEASSQPGFGGLCVGFGPINEGDKCPDDFRMYDESSGWVEDSEAAEQEHTS